MTKQFTISQKALFDRLNAVKTLISAKHVMPSCYYIRFYGRDNVVNIEVMSMSVSFWAKLECVSYRVFDFCVQNSLFKGLDEREIDLDFYLEGNLCTVTYTGGKLVLGVLPDDSFPIGEYEGNKLCDYTSTELYNAVDKCSGICSYDETNWQESVLFGIGTEETHIGACNMFVMVNTEILWRSENQDLFLITTVQSNLLKSLLKWSEDTTIYSTKKNAIFNFGDMAISFRKKEFSGKIKPYNQMIDNWEQERSAFSIIENKGFLLAQLSKACIFDKKESLMVEIMLENNKMTLKTHDDINVSQSTQEVYGKYEKRGIDYIYVNAANLTKMVSKLDESFDLEIPVDGVAGVCKLPLQARNGKTTLLLMTLAP
jgi:DNA polymerase III sliding clamp (beta) subunit (PCNA family)